jgi:hypothetical protein
MLIIVSRDIEDSLPGNGTLWEESFSSIVLSTVAHLRKRVEPH